MTLALLLLGCLPHKAPATFGALVPALPVVEDAETPPPAESPCPIEGVTAGQPMPHVDTRGLATCSGFLVDDALYAEWLTLPVERDLWKAAAVYQHESALDDRARCELVVDGERAARIECQRDNRVLRVAVPAAFVGGSILSAVLTYGLMSLAQAVSP